jgi:hypothetical protein
MRYLLPAGSLVNEYALSSTIQIWLGLSCARAGGGGGVNCGRRLAEDPE